MVAGNLWRWRNAVKEALERTAVVAKFLCLLHVTNNYICSPTLVYGPSMLPTLNLTGDVLLTEHITSRLGRLGLGDVVLVRSPENPRKTVTKRILGMEGDAVTFLVDPKNSDRCHTLVINNVRRCQRDMFGFRGIICMHRMIHVILGLFHMVLFKGKCSAGCGHLMDLDLWQTDYGKDIPL